ncbi:elongation factor Ts [Chloroflexota bacterium]
MEISTDMIKQLREQSGAGIMACRKALVENKCDIEQALEFLKQQSLVVVQKKSDRAATEGMVEAYIHTGGRIGALVEVNCETDFVARTGEFRELAHDLAMQVAAMCPEVISSEEQSDTSELEPQAACLLLQPYIKDQTKTVQDIINETIARVGENIRVSRFARFEVGVTNSEDD